LFAVPQMPLQPGVPPVVPASTSAPRQRWDGFIAEAAHRFEIPASWVRAVMQVESGGAAAINGQPITSPAGAMGPMQLMPKTWADLRTLLHLGEDPYDPYDNIVAGTAYLRSLADRFGFPALFAAYNAGPDRFEDHLRRGTPLPAETRTFLALVYAALGSLPSRLAKGPAPALFFPRGNSAGTLFMPPHPPDVAPGT